ncbi:hypothetical protein BH09BAC2_BH09BAC2_17540 [soil metagenome]
MKKLILPIIVIALFFSSYSVSCKKSSVTTSPTDTTSLDPRTAYIYYAYLNGVKIKAQFQQLSAEESAAAIQANPGLPVFYRNEDGPNTSPYIKILETKPALNSLLRKVRIVWVNALTGLKQEVSAAEVKQDASGSSPSIELRLTDEVYKVISID